MSYMCSCCGFFYKNHVSLLLLIIYNIGTYICDNIFSLNVIKDKFKLFKLAWITFINTYNYFLFVAFVLPVAGSCCCRTDSTLTVLSVSEIAAPLCCMSYMCSCFLTLSSILIPLSRGCSIILLFICLLFKVFLTWKWMNRQNWSYFPWARECGLQRSRSHQSSSYHFIVVS